MEIVIFSDDHIIVLFGELPNGVIIDTLQTDKSDLRGSWIGVLQRRYDAVRQIFVPQ